MTATRATAKYAIKRLGLTEVYATTTDTQVDVVFVHGLHGNPQDTWSSTSSPAIWPATLLGPILQEEKVRILVYGYDAQVASFIDGVSGDKIHNHAEQLVAELAANRRASKATEHPIIFVAHSFGGLVLKRALIYSSEISGMKTEHLRSIFVSTYGILFLGTPHKGLNASNWRLRLEAICQAALPKASVNDNLQLINTLKSNNETLQNIDRQFIQLSRSLHIFFFHEGKPTDLGGGRWEIIVEEGSASPNIQDVERAVIQKDHMQMCKFEDSGDPGFHLVTEAIQRYASEAMETIGPRWDLEKASQLAKRRAEAEELLRSSTCGRADAQLDPRLSEKPIFSVMSPGQVTAQAPKTKINFTVPFTRDRKFVERENIFQQLDAAFELNQRVSLVGLAGAGKSQIAIEHSFRLQEREPSTSIFWITASDQKRFEHGYASIAEKLKLPGCDDPKLDNMTLVKDWLTDDENGRWLLVLDNVDDENVFSAMSTARTTSNPREQQALAAFLPQTPQGFILVTSRNREAALQLVEDADCLVDVCEMTTPEALTLLRRKVSKDQSSDEVATDLVNALMRLPLAITQAASYISMTRMTIVNYLDRFRKNQTMYLAHEQPDIRRLKVTETASNSAIKTWSISFEYIRKHAPLAEDLLCLMSLLFWQRIPLNYLLSDWDHEDLEKALRPLLAFSLIEGDDDWDAFSIHQLVSLATRWWLKDRKNLQFWEEKSLWTVVNVFPGSEQANWEKCENLLPHAEQVLQYDLSVADLAIGRASLLVDTALYLLSQGSYHDPTKRLEDAHKTLIQSHGGNFMQNRSIYSVVCGLIRGYMIIGKYQDAEEIARQTLEAVEAAFGGDDPRTLNLLCELGESRYHQGAYAEAETIARQGLIIRESASTKGDHQGWDFLALLGMALKSQGKLTAAESAYRDLMNRRVVTGKSLNADTLALAHNLAIILAELGKVNEAEKMERDNWRDLCRLYGKEHPEAAFALSNLASILRMKGDLEAASAYNREALSQLQSKLDQDHPYVLAASHNATEILASQGFNSQGRERLRDVVDARARVLGPLHPDTLFSMSLLGTLYYREGDYASAEDLLSRVMRDQEKTFGKHYHARLFSAVSLTRALTAQGKLDHAEVLGRSTLEQCEHVLGECHPHTLRCHLSLLEVLVLRDLYSQAANVISLGLDRLKKSSYRLEVLTPMCDAADLICKHIPLNEALELKSRVAEVLQREYGELSQLTMQAVFKYAWLLAKGDRYREAEGEYQRLLNGRQQLLGANHPETLTAFHHVAFLRWKQGNQVDAELAAFEVFKARRSTLGLAHRDTESSISLLLTIFSERNKVQEAEALLKELQACHIEKLGSMHPEALKAGARVVDILAQQKQLDEAISLCVSLLEQHKTAFGPDDHSTMAMMRKLARLQYRHGNIPLAESLWRDILSRLGKTEVRTSPSALALEVMHDLAVCLHVKGRWLAAELLYRRCAEQHRKRVGGTSIEYLQSLGDVNKALLHQKKLDEAETISREVITGLTRTVGATHRETLTRKSDLTEILHEQGRDIEAEDLGWRVLQTLQERHEDVDSLPMMTIIRRLVLARAGQGKDILGCIMTAREVLLTLIATLGPAEMDTLASSYVLGQVLAKVKKSYETELVLRGTLIKRDALLGPEHPGTAPIRCLYILTLLGAWQGSQVRRRSHEPG